MGDTRPRGGWGGGHGGISLITVVLVYCAHQLAQYPHPITVMQLAEKTEYTVATSDMTSYIEARC